MSTLSEHVSLTITQDTVGIARAGFGVPLILSCNATFPERVRTYTDLPGLVDDGFATTSPEYLAASALLSQSPHPETIAVGRAVGKPTMRYKVTVSSVANAHTYSLLVKGPNLTETTVSYTSDGTATDGEICAALVTALNAVLDDDGVTPQSVYTAAGATSPISITGQATGNWFSVESLEPAYLKIEQDHDEPATTLATDLDAIELEYSDWYVLITLYNSDAYVKAAAAWIEASSNPKLYAAEVNASETVTLAAGGGDTADDLETLAYARTFVCYHPSPYDMFAAAWCGKVLPLEPGSETWKFKALSGVDPVSTTSTHRTNLRAKKANWIQTVAGRNITMEGTTADGDFIDVQRGLDWLNDDMTKAVFGALAGANKVPMTNAGIALVENEVMGSLKRAFNKGIIDALEKDAVVVPKVKDISTANRALRLLPDIKFKCRLAGAIHKVQISGVVSV
jgi:hypothetical protein